jgi:hypothetical protein
MADLREIRIRRLALTGVPAAQRQAMVTRLRRALVEGLATQGSASPEAIRGRVGEIAVSALNLSPGPGGHRRGPR